MPAVVASLSLPLLFVEMTNISVLISLVLALEHKQRSSLSSLFLYDGMNR